MFSPEYIKKSSEHAQKNRSERDIFNNIPIYIKDPLSANIDLDKAIERIERTIPRGFLYNVDVIYIGDFDSFHKDGRSFNAKYEDGALYISNIQTDEEDMVDDIIHEIAHAVEEQNMEKIYFDNTIEKEFLGKRKRLYQGLKQEGLNPPHKKFLQVNYDQELDNYLYKEVGYPILASLVVGLFYSPYAVTSLQEYFANGFENFFLRDSNYLKDISPYLYKRIDELVESAIGETI